MKKLIICLAVFSSVNTFAACFDRTTNPSDRVCALDLSSIPKDIVINLGDIASTCSHSDCNLKRDDRFVFKGLEAIKSRTGENPIRIRFNEFERKDDKGAKIRFLKGSVNGYDYYLLYRGEQDCRLVDSTRYKKAHTCKKYDFEIFSSNNTNVVRPEDGVWIDRVEDLEPSTGGGTEPPVDP